MKVMFLSLPGLAEKDGYLFPLGIGYLVAMLKGEYDVEARHYTSMREAQVDIAEKMRTFCPDVVGLTCSTFNRGFVRRAIALIRSIDRKAKLVVGGVHASFCIEQVLAEYDADVVVIGEGEQTIRGVCDAFRDGTDLGAVQGIAFRRDGHVHTTPKRSVVEDLDTLPMPDYSYARHLIEASKMGSIITSRGCPVQCTFCSTSSYWGQKVRMHSPQRIADEMEMLSSRYGVRKIGFADDTFNLGVARVEAICSEIKARGIRVEWACGCRVVPVTDAMIEGMVDAGCRHICWGIESGSEDMLKRIHKRITLEQIRRAYELSARHGAVMSTGAFAMVGNPGETARTICATVDFLNSVPMTDAPSTSILYVLPGTNLYRDIRARGLIREQDWVRYDTVPSYTLEHGYVTLASWAMRVMGSGRRLPFDRKRHFWAGLQGTPVQSALSRVVSLLRGLVKQVLQPQLACSMLRKLLPAGRIRF